MNYAVVGSDIDLLPVRRQAIIWTNNDLLLNSPLRTNYSEIRVNKKRYTIAWVFHIRRAVSENVLDSWVLKM